MTNTKLHNGQPGRRFREAADGPVIMRNYATMPTAELAERLGLTETNSAINLEVYFRHARNILSSRSQYTFAKVGV